MECRVPPSHGARRTGTPKASEFVFARLRYDSGDWDYNPKVAANVLNSWSSTPTFRSIPEEVVITAGSEELLSFPFLFMTGHKLVRFSHDERDQLRLFVEQGGLLFSDDCNHDVNGLYAKSFEEEMQTIFPRGRRRCRSCRSSTRSIAASSRSESGPPTTSHELNGWGDDIVHDYLRAARAPRSARRDLQQQGLRLRVGLRLAQQALPARGQHQVRGQSRRVCDDGVRLVPG